MSYHIVEAFWGSEGWAARPQERPCSTVVLPDPSLVPIKLDPCKMPLASDPVKGLKSRNVGD